MANETITTVVGNLTAGPRAALHPVRRGRRQLHRRVHPADLRPPSPASGKTGTPCSGRDLMNEISFTVVGNLTADPELRYTSSGRGNDHRSQHARCRYR